MPFLLHPLQKQLPTRVGRWRPLIAAACFLAIVWGVFGSFPLAAAQTQAVRAVGEASEEQVKAAFLFRFPHYTEWPASAFPKGDSAYVIGVAGDDDVADELQKISGNRLINNRPVSVKKINAGDALSELHVLFVGKAELARQSTLLKQAAGPGRATLIVTDVDGMLPHGSTINFRVADDRVRFDISLLAAERSGLKLSSRLLAIALSVIKDAQK